MDGATVTDMIAIAVCAKCEGEGEYERLEREEAKLDDARGAELRAVVFALQDMVFEFCVDAPKMALAGARLALENILACRRRVGTLAAALTRHS